MAAVAAGATDGDAEVAATADRCALPFTAAVAEDEEGDAPRSTVPAPIVADGAIRRCGVGDTADAFGAGAAVPRGADDFFAAVAVVV